MPVTRVVPELIGRASLPKQLPPFQLHDSPFSSRRTGAAHNLPSPPLPGMLPAIPSSVFSMPVWIPPRHWLPPARYWQAQVPAQVRAWLLEPGSLTAQLVALSHGDFRVRLLAHYWGRPAPEEARRLGLPPGRFALIREVALIGCGQPWVRARSVLPASSLTGAGRRLRKLGNRSLGGLLFRDPTLKRGAIEIARLDQPEGRVFARRSHLVYHGRPVLVAECFLPALFAHEAAQVDSSP